MTGTFITLTGHRDKHPAMKLCPHIKITAEKKKPKGHECLDFLMIRCEVCRKNFKLTILIVE